MSGFPLLRLMVVLTPGAGGGGGAMGGGGGESEAPRSGGKVVLPQVQYHSFI